MFLGTGSRPACLRHHRPGHHQPHHRKPPEELRLFLEEAAAYPNTKSAAAKRKTAWTTRAKTSPRVEDIQRELAASWKSWKSRPRWPPPTTPRVPRPPLRQQQLWFLKRAEAQAEQERVRVEGLQTVNALQERIAELRHTEAQLELLRQAHYDAGDAVNQAQAKLYEASAEVGKLEAEIRYVVEGRQRVEQRLAQLAAQVVEWNTRQQDASAELEQLEGQDMDAQEQAAILEAQLEEHAMRRARAARKRCSRPRPAPPASARVVVQVQQHIQVLAAEQRSLDETKPPAAGPQRARARRSPSLAVLRIRSSWPSCSSNSTRPAKPPNWPRRLCKELQRQRAPARRSAPPMPPAAGQR